jgi:hypothetical protein
MTTRRHRDICNIIEYVLSRDERWLTTAEITKRVNRLSPLTGNIIIAGPREVRLKLHTLHRDGRVRQTRDGRGYSWKWRP